MTYEVEIEGRRHAVSVRRHPEGDGWVLKVDDGPSEHIPGHAVDIAEWLFDFDVGRRSIGCHVTGELAHVQIAGHALRAEVVNPRDRALGQGGGQAEGQVKTPMPGVVVRIPVEEGTQVQKGQVLVVVEAMKMENEYKSPIDGRVARVAVQPGQAVEQGAVLIVVEPEAG